MATRIRAARAKSRMPARVKLTPYESDQISRIAAWKSIAPGPVAEFARKITFPASKVVEKAHTRWVGPRGDRAVISTGREAGRQR